MIYVQANDTNYYKNPEIGLDRWRLRIHADGTAELIVKHHESNNAAANLAGVIQILREHDYLFEPYGDRIDYVDRIFTGSKLEPAAIQPVRYISGALPVSMIIRHKGIVASLPNQQPNIDSPRYIMALGTPPLFI